MRAIPRHGTIIIINFILWMLLSIYAYLICNYFFHKIKRIDAKILLLLLACFFLQASQLSLATHDGNYDTCFYSSIGNIFKNDNFNYTITQAWSAEQAA